MGQAAVCPAQGRVAVEAALLAGCDRYVEQSLRDALRSVRSCEATVEREADRAPHVRSTFLCYGVERKRFAIHEYISVKRFPWRSHDLRCGSLGLPPQIQQRANVMARTKASESEMLAKTVSSLDCMICAHVHSAFRE